MLVLSRKKREQIMIADDIVVTVLEIRGNKVRLGFQAPADVPINRNEVKERINRENANRSLERVGAFVHNNGID